MSRLPRQQGLDLAKKHWSIAQNFCEQTIFQGELPEDQTLAPLISAHVWGFLNFVAGLQDADERRDKFKSHWKKIQKNYETLIESLNGLKAEFQGKLHCFERGKLDAVISISKALIAEAQSLETPMVSSSSRGMMTYIPSDLELQKKSQGRSFFPKDPTPQMVENLFFDLVAFWKMFGVTQVGLCADILIQTIADNQIYSGTLMPQFNSLDRSTTLIRKLKEYSDEKREYIQKHAEANLQQAKMLGLV